VTETTETTNDTTPTDPTTTVVPDAAQAAQELIELIDNRVNDPRWPLVRDYIIENDANLPEGGKSLRWVLRTFTGDKASVLARAKSIRSAARVHDGILASVMLVERRDRIRQHPCYGALYGRSRALIDDTRNPLVDAEYRGYLTRGISSAEHDLEIASSEIDLLLDVWAEAEVWLSQGWLDFLPEGPTQKMLKQFLAKSGEKQREYLFHGLRRQDMSKALAFFSKVVADNGHVLIEDDAITARWEEMFERELVRPHVPGQPKPATSGPKRKGKGRTQAQLERAERDRKDRETRRGPGKGKGGKS
jgi:hypothetical protein